MTPMSNTARIEELLVHREWVARVARALVVDEASADDLEQEVWVSVIQSPPAARPRSIRAWLGTILRFKAIDALRTDGRRRRREKAVARPESQPSAGDVVARGEVLKRVVTAVMDLDEPYRSTVLLRYFDDLSPPAIATKTGVPLETVRTRLRRGLVILRRRLDSESQGERRGWAIALLPLIRRPEPVVHGADTTAGIAGGLLMTLKAKVAIAAAVAALLLAGSVWHSHEVVTPPRPTRHEEAAVLPPATENPIPPSVGPPGTPVPGFLGRVLDADSGEAIPGVVVRAAAALGGEAKGEATTAGDGSFELQSKEAGPFTLTATKAGYEVLERRGAMAGTALSLRIRRLGAVAVRVKDHRGDPVPNAEITWLGEGGRSREAVTDAEGRALLDQLVPGTFMVGALPPEGLPDLSQAYASAVLLPGERHGVELELGPGIMCRGQVIDSETRVPVPAAQVMAVFGPKFRSWATDGDGRFTYPYFWADRPTWGAGVLVRAEGYETTDFKFRPSEDRDFVVPLRRATSHRVKVTGPDGTPAPRARVVVYGMNKLPLDVLAEGLTDDNGECVLGGFSPEDKSRYVFVAESSDGTLMAYVERTEGFPRGMRMEEGQKNAVSVPLGRCVGAMAVRLRSDTVPIEGRRVRLGCFPAEHAYRMKPGGFFPYPDLRMTLPAACVRQGDTDPAGQVSFDRLPEGVYAVEVEGRKDRGWFVNSLPKGGVLEIDLDEVSPERHEVRGVVRTAAGPMAQAFVHLVTSTGTIGDGAVTGADGRFRIETYQWPPTRISVSVREEGGSYRQCEFDPPREGEEADLLVLE